MRCRIAVALVIAFTLMPYVRRSYQPPTVKVETLVGGSRDRTLPGKARRRARRVRA